MRLLLAFLTILACTPKNGEPEPAKPSPAEVVITNSRATPVFVQAGGQCDTHPFSIKGMEMGVQADSCQDVRAGHCRDFGECAGPVTWRIEPGASLTTQWDGTYDKWTTIPAGEGCSTSCIEATAVPTGRHTLEVWYWTACEGECACAPGEHCLPHPGLGLNPDASEKLEIDLPAAKIAFTLK